MAPTWRTARPGETPGLTLRLLIPPRPACARILGVDVLGWRPAPSLLSDRHPPPPPARALPRDGVAGGLGHAGRRAVAHRLRPQRQPQQRQQPQRRRAAAAADALPALGDGVLSELQAERAVPRALPDGGEEPDGGPAQPRGLAVVHLGLAALPAPRRHAGRARRLPPGHPRRARLPRGDARAAALHLQRLLDGDHAAHLRRRHGGPADLPRLRLRHRRAGALRPRDGRRARRMCVGVLSAALCALSC